MNRLHPSLLSAGVTPPAEVVPARVVFESSDRGPVVRVLLLTPRAAQEIVDIVLSDRHARSLTVLVPNDTNDGALTWVRGQFIWLRRRGVDVAVQRRETMANAFSVDDDGSESSRTHSGDMAAVEDGRETK